MDAYPHAETTAVTDREAECAAIAHREDQLDEALMGSFPASDPITANRFY